MIPFSQLLQRPDVCIDHIEIVEHRSQTWTFKQSDDDPGSHRTVLCAIPGRGTDADPGISPAEKGKVACIPHFQRVKAFDLELDLLGLAQRAAPEEDVL